MLGRGIMRFLTLKCLVRVFSFYCASLLFSLMLVFGLGATHKDTIVFYAQTDTPEFMQLYFPVFTDASIYPTYQAEDSERVAYVGTPGIGIGLTLPDGAMKLVRVDPSDHHVNMSIKSVQLNYLFSTVTLTPEELLKRIVPLQGIDKIEVVGERLLINTSNEDPQFQLTLFKPDARENEPMLMRIGIVCSFLFTLLFAVLAKGDIRRLSRIFPGFAIPTIASLLIVWIFYPGFMTFDTLHALDGARFGVVDSTWPPVVSYIWRMIDVFSQSPVAMFFSQVLLLLGSMYYVMYYFFRKNSIALIFMLLYLVVPAVIGTVAAIWKDVLMASFFVAAFAAMLAMKERRTRFSFYALFGLSVLLVFLAVCSRHNAITAAVPLLFYAVWILSKRLTCRMPAIAFVALSGLILTAVVYTAKLQLDRYSIPEFREIKGATALIRVTRAMDIAGASVCSGKNLFENIAPALTLSEIQANYDPRHSNLSMGIISKLPFNKSLDELWFTVLKEYPVCFGYNKLMLSKYLVGANVGPQFLVVTPQIDANKYGYTLAVSSLRDKVVQYILEGSELVVFKPWVLYLVSILLFLWLLILKKVNVESVVVYFSAGFYFSGLALFGNAADTRLLFYTNTMSVLGVVVLLSQLFTVRFASARPVTAEE
ncbi:hypothetical protein [Pseudomonas sp. MWU318]|uniref:hypothetical protein n=1 Tax=Pseudomonas sp. MWU318 TaxID=2802569 RepID=UPI00192758A0|nr:hypothetical protein [Pseudomonas sp. MWU318]